MYILHTFSFLILCNSNFNGHLHAITSEHAGAGAGDVQGFHGITYITTSSVTPVWECSIHLIFISEKIIGACWWYRLKE